MKIWDNIKARFSKSNHVLWWRGAAGFMPDWEISKHKFGETMYLNIVEMLTDIFAEVTFTQVGVTEPTAKFIAWRNWVQRNGQRILVQLYRDKGYAVIGYDALIDESGSAQWRFYELGTDAYVVRRKDDVEYVECKDQMQKFYVLKSPTFEAVGKSDHSLCEPFIKMLDAVLNGATTTSERLGAYVVMTPKSDNFGGVLEQDEKDEIEKEIQREYGMLSKQKQVMVLPRPMDSNIVSLAGVDIKMQDKARTALLGIADRIKVPANQIAFIDANSSKSLSNGTELREGDMAKYRQFRRVLNATFYDMAHELGMRIDYTIENEPKSVQGQQIENV